MTTTIAPTTSLAKGSAVPRPAAWRNPAVEARKLFDTRGAWGLTALAAFLAGGMAGGRLLAADAPVEVSELYSMASIGPSSITMAMAALLVAAEFTTGTAATTFALEPRRGRVVGAKALVVVGLAVVASLLCLLAAVLVGLVGPSLTGHAVVWDGEAIAAAVPWLTATFAFVALAAFGLALLVRNAVAPIVVLLVWPTLTALVASSSETGQAVVAHVDAQAPLQILSSGVDAAVSVLVSTLVWIAVPTALGFWRLLRNDL